MRISVPIILCDSDQNCLEFVTEWWSLQGCAALAGGSEAERCNFYPHSCCVGDENNQDTNTITPLPARLKETQWLSKNCIWMLDSGRFCNGTKTVSSVPEMYLMKLLNPESLNRIDKAVTRRNRAFPQAHQINQHCFKKTNSKNVFNSFLSLIGKERLSTWCIFSVKMQFASRTMNFFFATNRIENERCSETRPECFEHEQAFFTTASQRNVFRACPHQCRLSAVPMFPHVEGLWVSLSPSSFSWKLPANRSFFRTSHRQRICQETNEPVFSRRGGNIVPTFMMVTDEIVGKTTE